MSLDRKEVPSTLCREEGYLESCLSSSSLPPNVFQDCKEVNGNSLLKKRMKHKQNLLLQVFQETNYPTRGKTTTTTKRISSLGQERLHLLLQQTSRSSPSAYSTCSSSSSPSSCSSSSNKERGKTETLTVSNDNFFLRKETDSNKKKTTPRLFSHGLSHSYDLLSLHPVHPPFSLIYPLTSSPASFYPVIRSIQQHPRHHYHHHHHSKQKEEEKKTTSPLVNKRTFFLTSGHEVLHLPLQSKKASWVRKKSMSFLKSTIS